MQFKYISGEILFSGLHNANDEEHTIISKRVVPIKQFHSNKFFFQHCNIICESVTHKLLRKVNY